MEPALTSREATVLVTLFAGTTGRDQQRALLDEPRSAIAANRGDAPTNPHDPRLGPCCNALRRQVAFVLEGLARLDRQAQAVETAGWTDAERGVLAPSLRQVAGLASRTSVTVLAVASAMEAGNATGR